MQVKLVDELQDKILETIEETLKEINVNREEYFFKEGDFVEKFGVSRSSVREAVRSLEVRGFLERVHGRGVRAIDKSVQVVTNSLSDMIMRSKLNLDDVTQVRRIIEVASAGIAAEIADANDIERLKDCVKTMLDESVTYMQYLEADLSFHRVIIESTKNNILISFVNAYQDIIRQEIIASTREDYRPELTHAYHQKILDCIVSRDAKAAKNAMSNHLNATEDNIRKLHNL